MKSERVFLDANILFSIAYRSPGLSLIAKRAQAGKCLLYASQYIIEETKRNLSAPDQFERLDFFLSAVQIEPEIDPHTPCPIDLPEKDRPVLMAAISIKAAFLLTGDTVHFGNYSGKIIAGVKICCPRDNLSRSQTE
jgi:predicted nucleic acid-binding protein